LPVVSCEPETWSLTLSEEHRLRVFSNVLRNIFGPKRAQVTRGLCNCIMRDFTILLFINNYSGDQIEKDEMGQTCGTCGAHKKCTKFFCGET